MLGFNRFNSVPVDLASFLTSRSPLRVDLNPFVESFLVMTIRVFKSMIDVFLFERKATDLAANTFFYSFDCSSMYLFTSR